MGWSIVLSKGSHLWVLRSGWSFHFRPIGPAVSLCFMEGFIFGEVSGQR